MWLLSEAFGLCPSQTVGHAGMGAVPHTQLGVGLTAPHQHTGHSGHASLQVQDVVSVTGSSGRTATGNRLLTEWPQEPAQTGTVAQHQL
jgi:hypothetical protein